MGKRSIKEGSVVLITGGASGIGKLVAKDFASKNCKVVIVDINENAINETVKELKSIKNCEAFGYKCNIIDPKAVKEMAENVRKDAGNVDILINNAGIVSGKNLFELTDEQIQRTMDVNATSHFYTIREFAPSMIKKNFGTIVTVASAAGISATSKLVDYCSSKFAAFGTNEALRLELRKMGVKGVDTLCVCPYYISTGMFEGVKTKFPLILPILEPSYVAKRIVDSIEHRDTHLILPSMVRITFLARFLFPTTLFDNLGDFLGVSNTMDDFKGRNN